MKEISMYRRNISAIVTATKINTFCWVSGYCRHKILIVVGGVIRNLLAVMLFPHRDRNVLSNNYRPQKRHGPRYRDRATERLLLTPSAPLHAPAPLASPISHEFSNRSGDEGLKGRRAPDRIGRGACADRPRVRRSYHKNPFFTHHTWDARNRERDTALPWPLMGAIFSSARDALALSLNSLYAKRGAG